MKMTFASISAVFLLAVAGTTACRATDPGAGSPAVAVPPIVQPGAPGSPSRAISAADAAAVAGTRHTAADVEFMQGMIGHHAQALDLTALVAARTNDEDMRMLALRIQLSQEDEILMMQRWLEIRGEEAPRTHAHHEAGAMLMPGMLTAEEMSRLEDATGPEFDRLFLESMIKHHEGALIMVDDLFATAGAGQESNIFAFASDVVADQRAEMDRMTAMINAKFKEQ